MLGGYEGVILNKVGMTMEMVGPEDVDRLRETCRGIVTENNTVSDAEEDNKSTAMQTDIINHYEVMEWTGWNN